MQHSFRIFEALQVLTIFALILAVGNWLRERPDRTELGLRTATLTFETIRLNPAGFGRLRLAGAWTVTSTDPRFGGISALAIDGGRFLALTDSGVVIRFSPPGPQRAAALIRELPDGPGSRFYKPSRDSEALVLDPQGRGWWVAFENRNQLWLYDRQLAHALGAIRFGKGRWKRNRGVEGLATDGAALLALSETGREVVRIEDTAERTFSIENPRGRISDAARLPSGEIAVIQRSFAVGGLSNRLAMLERTKSGYRIASSQKPGVGPLDNFEAVAPQRLPDGRVRLWLMTDDNFQRPFRTLLIALDLP